MQANPLLPRPDIDRPSAVQPPQPEPQTAHILYELIPPQLPTIDLLPKDDNIPLTSAIRETFGDELTQSLTAEENRDLQQHEVPVTPVAKTPANNPDRPQSVPTTP